MFFAQNTSQGRIILVGGFNPSEKYQSVGMIIPNIWKNKNVPNHQPVLYRVSKRKRKTSARIKHLDLSRWKQKWVGTSTKNMYFENHRNHSQSKNRCFIMLHDGSRFHHSWSQIPSLWVLKFSNDIFMIFPHFLWPFSGQNNIAHF